MATKLKNFKPPKRKPKTTKYPWSKWLRVGTLRLKKGKKKDFTCALPTMADNIRRAAKKVGKDVQVWIETDSQTIVFRVTRPKN